MKKFAYAVKQLPRFAARKMLRTCLVTEKTSREEIASINWQRRLELLESAIRD